MCDNVQLSEPCSCWKGQWLLTGYNNALLSRCDVTAWHYYGQLITAAHATVQQLLHHSVSMGNILDTSYHLEAMATVLQTIT